MDTNSKVVKIDSNNPTFKIYLYSTDYFPDLYSSPTDPSQTISCVQQNAYLECTPNDSMKRNGDYPIYYKDRCNGIQPTGITVKVSRKIEVSPVALSFDNGSRCLMNPPSSVTVIISFSEEMYGTFWDGALENSIGNPFTLTGCNPDGQTVKCTTDEQLTANSYKLDSMTASDFTITKNADIEPLITYSNPIGTNEATQTVVDGASDFKIKLLTSSPPNFYVGNDKTKKLDCTLSVGEVSCHTNHILMPDAKSYEIYWENQCGEMNKLENI